MPNTLRKLLVCVLVLTHGLVLGQRVVQGQAVARLKPAHKAHSRLKGTGNAELDQVMQQYGIQATPTFPSAGKSRAGGRPSVVDLTAIVNISFDPRFPADKVLQALRATGLFAYVEPRYVYETFAVPNDPQAISQYQLSLIHLADAWDIHEGDENVVIAIVDVGTQFDHQDLVGNIAYNLADPINGIDDDGDGYMDNYQGWDLSGADFGSPPDNDTRTGNHLHGTWVSGYASATYNNGLGITGIGGKCRFLPIKTSPDTDPWGIYTGYEGIVYAADHGAKIINCSWGGPNYSGFGQDVVNYATYDRDAVVVAAAGNSGIEELYYPASFENVVAVATSTNTDVMAGGATYNIRIDVTAPGGGSPTTDRNGGYATGGYASSFASPMAAGVLALIRSYFPAYTAVQAAARLRATATNIDALNPVQAGLLGGGRIDALAALTATTPGIVLESYAYANTEGLPPKPGDMFSLTLQVRNMLDPATDLQITAEVNSPYLTILQGDFAAGALATLQAAENSANPFMLLVDPSTPSNTTVRCTLHLEDGSYTDQEYIELMLNPSYTQLDNDYLQLTLTDNGLIGYTQTQVGRTGSGFGFSEEPSILFEGGFLVAQSAALVADNLQSPAGGASKNDWLATQGIAQRLAASTPLEYDLRFQDQGKIGLSVRQQVHAYTVSPDNEIVILRYTLRNETAAPLSGLYAGLLGDWEMGISNTNDSAEYIPSERMVLVHGNSLEDRSTYLGLVGLTQSDSVRGYAGVPGIFDYTDAAKYAALKAPDTQVMDYSDVMSALSVGLTDLPAGDSVEVAFAVLLSSHLPALYTQAAEARVRYACLLTGASQTHEPETRDSCVSALLDATMPGATAYAWSSGSTSAREKVSASGRYWARILNAEACVDYKPFDVIIYPAVSPQLTLTAPSGAYTVGEPIDFADEQPDADSYMHVWDFSDGSTPYTTATGTHTYTLPGDYEVIVYVQSADGCSKQDTIALTVEPVLSQEPPQLAGADFQVYPNPAHGDAVYLTYDGTNTSEAILTLFDPSGRRYYQVRTTPVSWQEPYILPVGQTAGVYILTISSGDTLLHYKILRR